jgi:hypothetical protein
MSTVRFRHCGYTPSYARSWTRTTKEGTVDAEFADMLASAMRQLGHRVIRLEPKPNPSKLRNSSSPLLRCSV